MKNKPKLASNNTCTGCMVCIDKCTHNALFSKENKDGHLYVDFNSELCISCGKCTKVCPVVGDYSFNNDLKQSKPYSGWATDDSLRLKSSSGGIFAAIAEYFLLQKWYVAGAIQDGFSVKHIITNRIEDLEKIQNSKYQQGNLAGIYLQSKNILLKGQRLLFSGTSCQIAGLLSFLGDNHDYSNLYTIDLVCSGFTSILPLRKFIENESTDIKNIAYRNKKNGWVNTDGKIVCQTITATTQGVIKDYGKNFIYSAFFSHLTIRNSCLDCKFAFMHRKSDITLADFWGDKDYPSEHYKGVSAIISNTYKGSELLNNSDIILNDTDWEKILSRNYRLIVGKYRFYKYHPIRFLYPFIFRNCSYTFVKKIFGGKQQSVIWLPYRIMCAIIGRMSFLFLKKDLVKTLKNSR